MTDSALESSSCVDMADLLCSPSCSTGPYMLELEVFDQSGEVFVGPGVKKHEVSLLGIGLAELTSQEARQLRKAKWYAMDQSKQHVMFRQHVQHRIEHDKVFKFAHALALMCRLYVGSISSDAGEDALRDLFGVFGPIKHIDMSYDPSIMQHMGYAFVEFDVPEAATLAVNQLVGTTLCGRVLKVSAPQCVASAQKHINMILNEATKYQRIYVGSISTELTDEDVASVFGAFGRIKSCELPKVNVHSTKHRGFAYIEYETDVAVQDAITSMNMFDLGGHYLRVCRALTPPQTSMHVHNEMKPQKKKVPITSAKVAASVTAEIESQEASAVTGLRPPKVVISGQVHALDTLPGTAVFAVPPPGLAVPQLPNQPPVNGDQPCGAPTATTSHTEPSTALANKRKRKKKKKPTTISQNQGATLPADTMVVSLQTTIAVSNQSEQEVVAAAPLAVAAAEQQPMDADGGHRCPVESTDLVRKELELRQALVEKMRQRKLAQSRVLVLKNLVGQDDVWDDELEGEILSEVAKYGDVQRLECFYVESAPKIFVLYAQPSEVAQAKAVLNGRFFAGRTVLAESYNQDLFDRNDFTG